jgi:hypothetical protein
MNALILRPSSITATAAGDDCRMKRNFSARSAATQVMSEAFVDSQCHAVPRDAGDDQHNGERDN